MLFSRHVSPPRALLAGPLIALSVVAACNGLLDNHGAELLRINDSGTETDAASSSSSGASGSSSSSSSGGSSSSSSSGGPSGACACGELDGSCAACPLVSIPIAAGLDPALVIDIAATDHALWLLQNGYLVSRIALDPTHDDALSPQIDLVDSAGTVRRLVSPLQPVRELADSAPDDVVFGQRTQEATSTFGTTICAGLGMPLCNDNESIAGVTQMEAAIRGVLISRSQTAVSYFQLPSAGAGTVSTLDDLPNPLRSLPLAANSTRAFWFLSDTGADPVPRIGTKLYASTTEPTTPLAVDAAPRTLAANEERVFAAPCAGSPACSYPAAASSTGQHASLLAGVMGAGPEIQSLYVDGSRLVASTDGATYLCDLHDCSALPAPWQGASVRSFTRNSHSIFALVGGSLYRARRTPLKATTTP